jgi:hypothetical protein
MRSNTVTSFARLSFTWSGSRSRWKWTLAKEKFPRDFSRNVRWVFAAVAHWIAWGVAS